MGLCFGVVTRPIPPLYERHDYVARFLPADLPRRLHPASETDSRRRGFAADRPHPLPACTMKGFNMSTPTLYTPSDVAEALSVTPMAVNNWQKRYSDCPAPAFVRTNGAPLWDTLEAWRNWNTERLIIVEAENKAKAEARLAKAKAEYDKAMAAMEEV